MARMKTSRMTAKMGGPGDPPKTTVKKESSNAGDWSKYEAYVSQKKAYDTDKTEYDARWKKANESSRGSISPYNFEKAPAEVKPPVNDRVSIKKPKREVAGLGGFNGESSAKANFNNPKVAQSVKTKYAHGSDGISKKVKNPKQVASEGIINESTTSRNKIGYNKEKRRFASFAGETSKGVDFTKMTSSQIKNYRDVRKDDRRMDRKSDADASTKAQRITSNTMDIRQSRKAEKFAKGIEKGGNTIKHFTDKNYGGNIVKDYKNSTDNANNRNTMDAKIKAAGEKAKRGSFGGMPTS